MRSRRTNRYTVGRSDENRCCWLVHRRITSADVSPPRLATSSHAVHPLRELIGLARRAVPTAPRHFKDAINLDCANDAAAIASAKRLINHHDVELWQEDRMVIKLATSVPAGQ
jgi:hypothetical protein